ncbi:Panacea domain-containing protein [Helicobacter didelphidarum]|nr:type II toxin-antitoxin system antitoxin SocA domain-containing protein [Helicobacter didelphidarum]
MRAYEVARYFLFLAEENDELITKLKMQKLLYYAQAYSMYYLKTPLFDDKIHAWKLGPVVTNVYHTLEHDSNNILLYSVLKDFDTDMFSEEQKAIIRMCWKDYGKYTSSYLVSLTHNEESYKKHYKENCNNVIPLHDITKSLEKRDVKYIENVERQLNYANN